MVPVVIVAKFGDMLLAKVPKIVNCLKSPSGTPAAVARSMS